MFEKLIKKIALNLDRAKIPYMLIVGDREEKSGEVSVRLRTGEDLKNMPIEKFTEIILKDIADKR